MPEVNTDKIFAAFLLRLEEVAQIEDFDDIEKEFLGKNSLLSEERKSLSSLNEVSRKKYGKLLQDLANNITSKLEEEKTIFKSKFFKKIKIPIGIKIMNNGMRFQPKNLTKFSIPVKTYGMPVFELVCTGSCDTYTAVSTILPNNVSYPAASILYDVMGSMIIRKIVNTIRYFKNTFNLSFLNLIKNIIDIPKNKNNPSERINDANVIIANETNIIFLFSILKWLSLVVL